MKRICLLFAFILPLVALAQTGDGRKYLVGAVPEKDGAVVFEKTVSVPGRSATELFDELSAYAAELLAGSDNKENARVIGDYRAEGQIAMRMDELIYFKKSALQTSFTRMSYNLTFFCKDGEFTVSASNISYVIDPDENGGGGTVVRAEKWITDKEGLNKKQDKPAKVSGKYRVKTIDRFAEIVNGARRATKAQ